MANTKVTGDLIASGTITAANLVSGTLDTLLNGYLTTNSYATESYVTTAVSNLIDAAPASLDTLNELAAALNDDANFATTVTDSIATKLPLAGGTLTGSLDINTSDALRFRFLNSGTFKAGVEVATTAGDMIASSVIDDLAIRSQTNMLFSTGGNTEHMRITSTGNVGIGTASPETELDILGTLTIQSSSANIILKDTGASDNEDWRIVANGGPLQIQSRTNAGVNTSRVLFDNNGDVSFYEDTGSSVKLFWDASAESLGIGTSSPNNKLIVNGGIGAIGEASAGLTNGILIDQTASTLSRFLSYSATSSAIAFYTGTNSSASERVRIDSSGNVGIGTGGPGSYYSKELVVSAGVEGGITIVSNSTDGAYLMFADGTSGADRYRGYVNYSHLTNELTFGTNGSQRVTVDSSGNVGIGTSSPTEGNLVVRNDSGNANINIKVNDFDGSDYSPSLDFSTGGQGANDPQAQIKALGDNSYSAHLIFSTQNPGTTNPLVERMRILSSGQVIVGAFGGNDNAVVAGSSSPGFTNQPGTNLLLKSGDGSGTGSSFMSFSTSPGGSSGTTVNTAVERMRITSGGNVLIGTTTDIAANITQNAVVNKATTGTLIVAHETGNTGSLFAQFVYAGTGIGSISQVGTTGVAYNTSSDYRLKENVAPMEGALDRVAKLQPSRFNFIGDEKTVDGFLAHEVAEIVPEAITGEKDAVDEEGNPVYQGIDQSKIVPLLVGAIKELKDIVDQQQIEINNLKAQLNG
jgi:hypothetical protein